MLTSPTPEEISLLNNFNQRNLQLKDKPLIIQGRIFKDDIRFDDYRWEDTQFINCDFVGTLMFRGTLKNVRFDNCVFASNRFEEGSWENVSFIACAGRNAFTAAPSIGKNTLFEDCEFIGTTPEAIGYGHKTDHYGAVGGGNGDVIYRRCHLERMGMTGGSSLTIQDCKLYDVIGGAHKNSKVVIENIDGKGLVNFGGKSENYSSFVVRNSVFNKLFLRSATVGSGLFENIKVNLNLDIVKASEIHLRNVTFINDSRPNEHSEYGLHTKSAKIQHLRIDSCQFEGSVAAMYLAGEEGDTADVITSKDSSKKNQVNVYSRKFSTLTIRTTPIIRGKFQYMRVGTLLLEDLTIQDADFSHGEFDKFILRGVTLSGKVDFADTRIHHRLAERVSDTSTGTPPTILKS